MTPLIKQTLNNKPTPVDFQLTSGLTSKSDETHLISLDGRQWDAHDNTEDDVSHRGWYQSARSSKGLIAASVGSSVNQALLQARARGRHCGARNFLCFQRSISARGNISGPPIKSKAGGHGSSWAVYAPTWRPCSTAIFTARLSSLHWLQMQIKVLNKGHWPRQPLCFSCFFLLFQYPFMPVWPSTPGYKDLHCGGDTAGQSSCTGQWLTSLATSNTLTKAIHMSEQIKLSHASFYQEHLQKHLHKEHIYHNNATPGVRERTGGANTVWNETLWYDSMAF